MQSMHNVHVHAQRCPSIHSSMKSTHDSTCTCTRTSSISTSTSNSLSRNEITWSSSSDSSSSDSKTSDSRSSSSLSSLSSCSLAGLHLPHSGRQQPGQHLDSSVIGRPWWVKIGIKKLRTGLDREKQTVKLIVTTKPCLHVFNSLFVEFSELGYKPVAFLLVVRDNVTLLT